MLGPFSGERRLGLGERDPEHRGPVLAGRVDREAAPTAADVEHAGPSLDFELGADQLQLGALGLLEGGGSVLEQAAAVGHRLVEKQFVELVGDVVVVAHRFRIAGLGVPVSCASDLGGRKRRWPADSPGAQRRHAEAKLVARAEGGWLPAADQVDHRVEVIGVELPEHVGAPGAELAGGAGELGDHGRVAQANRRSDFCRRRNKTAVPKFDRKRAIREGARNLPGQRRGPAGGACDQPASRGHARVRRRVPPPRCAAAGCRGLR